MISKELEKLAQKYGLSFMEVVTKSGEFVIYFPDSSIFGTIVRYDRDKIICLFNHTLEYCDSKLHPIFGEFTVDYAPFSTLDELNYLYDKSIKNIEDNLTYLSNPNFVQSINKYKENSEHIDELTEANENLKEKACTILLKKAVISNEFEEK